MALGMNSPSSVFGFPSVQVIAASTVGSVVSKERVGVTRDGSLNLRADFIVGEVTVAAAVTGGLHSNAGYGWSAAIKPVTITASTPVTVTAAGATNIFTAATHGLVDDDVLVVSNSGGALPAGMAINTKYYVQKIDANTFYLNTRQADAGSRLDITTDGTGTNSYTKARTFSVFLNVQNSTDQAYMPLQGSARLYVTTGAGDSCQVLDTLLFQGV